MIKLIVGNKGTGKTKVMVDMINENLEKVKGNIVCIEKSMQLGYTIPTSVRLIDVDEFKIKGCKRFYGFFAGVCASNYDIEQIYVDGILKVLEYDMEDFADLIEKIEPLAEDKLVVFTVSAEENELPEELKKYL
ncbi:MAG: hypothetical protein IKV52_02220 [Oscillospiraceae bacterium]|nr:hypothetical protein [Oscillospiraceae bacterium]MBR5305689.1 hypothetical protein [Oscillospiraceae bacterium]